MSDSPPALSPEPAVTKPGPASPREPRRSPSPSAAPPPTACTGASDSRDIEDLIDNVSLTSSDSEADGPTTRDAGKTLYPTVPFYGPCILRGLKPGERKRWCTCGLSKTQPWCDNAHIGTPFKPLVWKVPDKAQTIYSICNCKYTKSPPYCDAEHTNCPIDIYRRQKACQSKHEESIKICVDCGWTPDTVLIDL